MKTIILDQPGRKRERILLDKPGQKMEILGVVLGQEKGIYELNIETIHKVSKAGVKVLIKGIAENGAVVKVGGKMVMEENLSDLDDSLELRILVLDEASTAFVDPQMEIKSNEVMASHAASVGQIEQEKIDYLMSRGLSEKKAKQTIVNGFLKEITDRINI